jgi:hypothetical protein
MSLVYRGAELGGHVFGVHDVLDADSDTVEWSSLTLGNPVKRLSLAQDELRI